MLNAREITKALPTADRRVAIPLALSLAHQAKVLFNRLRGMTRHKNNPDDESTELRYIFEIELDDLGLPKRLKVQAEPHEQAAVDSAIQTALTNSLQARRNVSVQVDPQPIQIDAPRPARGATTPMFSQVIDDFLSRYQQGEKPAMFKKHKPVLAMLLDVVGDKPVDELRQSDINGFFELLGKLPPRWVDQCRRQGLGVRQLAELEHEVTIGPKTFEDTYVASVRPFLKAAKKNFQDEGFPLGLTTEGTEYTGDREEGEYKQRALTPSELKRLFVGPEIQGFANDPALAHLFWLPHLGLFTGARVNELCQVNPQTDILPDPASGTWHLWITTETEADPRVRKSVKTGDSRKVPIHKMLVALGFLEYVARIKAAGAKLLFPQWEPVNKRASGEAEKWFRQLLRDTGLRDETPKACLLGMHAFRHYPVSRNMPTDLRKPLVQG